MSLLRRLLGGASKPGPIGESGEFARAFVVARMLHNTGRLHEAMHACLRLHEQGYGDSEFLVLLGGLRLRFGQYADAEVAFRKALEHSPVDVPAQHGLADALTRQRRFDAAIAVCKSALAVHPDAGALRMVLGDCEQLVGDPERAGATYEQAALSAGFAPRAHFALGVLMRAQGRHQEAVAQFTKAEQRRHAGEGETDAFIDLALAYEALGQSARGIDVLEAELAARPALEAHRLLAQLLLAQGRMREGWEHYEFRWMLEPLLAARLGPVRPPWVGQDLRGKTILLRLEQGFGDVIQFARYARHVKALGATVLMADFSGLAKSVQGVDRAVLPHERPPPFDYYVNLLSLPRIFGTELDSIPGDGRYIVAEPARVQAWQAKVPAGTGLSVGLVWAGNASYSRDDERSLAVDVLAPLLAVEGVRFVLLQKGDRASEAAALAPPAFNLGPYLVDFADTAAVIDQLDLVIAVDTAVAHLAGALGKPVWVMLPAVCDWRWMHDRDDSPWYPTMRLFRQERQGGWASVVERMVRELERYLREGLPLLPHPSGTATPRRELVPLPIGSAVQATGMVAESRHGIVQYQPDQPFVGRSIRLYGEWLPSVVDVLARMVPDGGTVIEVDAGIGMHALPLASMVGGSGRVLLAEAEPARRRMLQQNLEVNRVGNATVLSPVGQVAPGAIDDLQLARLDLIKINDGRLADDVLHGATQTMWQQRPNLVIGASDEDELYRLKESVQTFGYRVWRLEAPLFTSGNFYCNSENVFGDRCCTWLLGLPEEVDIELPGVRLSALL